MDLKIILINILKHVLECVKNGFPVEHNSDIMKLTRSERNFYFDQRQYMKLFEKITEEIEAGILVPILYKPRYVCPIGGVWKDEEKGIIRKVHNCSFCDQLGMSLNQ